MPVRMDKFKDASHFEAIYTFGVENSARWRKTLDERGDEIDRQIVTQYVLMDCLSCGSIGVLLGYDDVPVRQFFACATEYGRRLLSERGRVPDMRELEFHMGPQGVEKVVTGENIFAGMTEYPLSISYYHRATVLALAFGDASTCAEFAAYPEERYRSPGIVTTDAHFRQLRAHKAWIRGETAQAIRDFEAVRDDNATPYTHALMSAWLALERDDLATFRAELTKVLEAHKALYRRKSNDPEGIVCFPALALSRLARTRGIEVEDDGYMPARLVASTPVR